MITKQQICDYLESQNKLIHGVNFSDVMIAELLTGIYTIEQLQADIELYFNKNSIN